MDGKGSLVLRSPQGLWEGSCRETDERCRETGEPSGRQVRDAGGQVRDAGGQVRDAGGQVNPQGDRWALQGDRWALKQRKGCRQERQQHQGVPASGGSKDGNGAPGETAHLCPGGGPHKKHTPAGFSRVDPQGSPDEGASGWKVP